MSRYKEYPSYKESGVEWIGRVPEHWDVKRLRHVATFSNSNVDKKYHEGQKSIRLCNYTDVYKNEFIYESMPFMESTASEIEFEKFRLRQNDVIITKDSEDPSDIGIPAIIKNIMKNVVCGYHLSIIRTFDPRAARFLHRSLQSRPTKAYFFVECLGITRYGLGQDSIGNTLICLPSKIEYEQIADALDLETARIDALIAKKTHLIELLKEKRQSIIAHAVTKGLDPNADMKASGVEWIEAVPSSWERLKIFHSFIRIGSGTTPPTSQPEWYSNNEVPWITSGELKENIINFTEKFVTQEAIQEFSALHVYPAGSLVIAMYGATIGRLGILGIPATTNQACCVLVPGRSLDVQFVFYWMQASKQPMIDLYAVGGGQPNINQEIISRIRIPAPTMNVQSAIVAMLDRETKLIDEIIAKQSRSIDLLKEKRRTLITAAVTGQIDLREHTP